MSASRESRSIYSELQNYLLTTMERDPSIKNNFESEDQSIVEHNLRMMDTDMQLLLMGESIGGNASAFEIEGKYYSCGGANGYADPEIGSIVKFGNFQNLKKEITLNNSEFTLRVAFDLRRPRGFFKIVSFSVSRAISPRGKKNIELSVEQYNAANA